jgi:TIR domain
MHTAVEQLMSADIFISYASQDGRMATTICSALESRGFKCWVSTRDILPGENFQSAIVRAIRSAKVLLLVFTANSNRSDEMTKELALASQQKLMVVPLRVENVTPSDAFAYEFATRQWIDLFADWEQAMNNLCVRLSAALEDDRTHVDTIVIGKPSLQDPGLVARLNAMRRRHSRSVWVIAAAVVIAGVLGVTMPLLYSKPSANAAAIEAPAAKVVADPAAVSAAAVAVRLSAVPAAELAAAAAPPAVPPDPPAVAKPAAAPAAAEEVSVVPQPPAAPKPARKPVSSKKKSSNLPY